MDLGAIFLIVSLVGLGGGLAGVKEGPIGERGGSYNRQAWGVPVQKNGVKNGVNLETHVYFPKIGIGPIPSVVFGHGSPRGTFRPTVFYDAQAKWFTDWGYAVVPPKQRGFELSHGNWTEN